MKQNEMDAIIKGLDSIINGTLTPTQMKETLLELKTSGLLED